MFFICTRRYESFTCSLPVPQRQIEKTHTAETIAHRNRKCPNSKIEMQENNTIFNPTCSTGMNPLKLKETQPKIWAQHKVRRREATTPSKSTWEVRLQMKRISTHDKKKKQQLQQPRQSKMLHGVKHPPLKHDTLGTNKATVQAHYHSYSSSMKLQGK